MFRLKTITQDESNSSCKRGRNEFLAFFLSFLSFGVKEFIKYVCQKSNDRVNTGNFLGTKFLRRLYSIAGRYIYKGITMFRILKSNFITYICAYENTTE